MKHARSPLPTGTTGLVLPENSRGFWHRLMGETRTRILLLYITSMLGVTAIAIPIFRGLFIASVDARVRADLIEELEEFEQQYEAWQATTAVNPTTLKTFVNGFMQDYKPEDDNFHIVLLDGAFYRANPAPLPPIIREESDLMQSWLKALESPSAGEEPSPLLRGEWLRGQQESNKPEIGNILYKAVPLMIDGQVRGAFVATHLTAGEQAEALDGVYIFTKVALGVVGVSFLLAWLGSRELFSPVRSLAKTARSISESNLSERLQVQGQGELAELASTFNAMMNRLENAFESQRNFLNDASHELRTPITIIQGHLEVMGDDPDEQQETLELVMDELERMARFVNDLILLAKSERPDFLRPETIDIATFTREIHQKAIALAPRDWQLHNLGKGMMVGDRQRLAGALLNLIHNAAQHTRDGALIEIGSVVKQGEVRFWVRDTGEGISPQDQSRIFERFARVANRYRASEGAGLGLAIVKAIVEAHEGRIELTSQVGIGSTFTLIFPLELSSDLPQEHHVA